MRKQLLYWLCLGVVTLFLMEAMVAAYFLSGVSRLHYRTIYMKQDNDVLNWRTERDPWGAWHLPDYVAHQHAHCFGATYRSNSYGARDKPRALKSAAKRAVMLGDSFVEGYGVDAQYRVSDLLEKKLGVEILNFGSAGNHGPLQYEILYRELASRFDHDLVIVGFLPANDFFENEWAEFSKDRGTDRRYRPYYTAVPGKAFYPRDVPAAGELSYFQERYRDARPERFSFKQLFWLYGLYLEVRTNIEIWDAAGSADYVGWFEDKPQRLADAAGSLARIKAASGKPMLVFFIPSYADLLYLQKGDKRRTSVERLSALLAPNGIETFDLTDSYLQRGKDIKRNFLRCDGHWNEEGNSVAADALEAKVRARLAADKAARR